MTVCELLKPLPFRAISNAVLLLDDAMRELVLPPLLDEPKILEDREHTWSVTNWRSFGKKEHGPIFHAGGYPWCALCLSDLLPSY